MPLDFFGVDFAPLPDDRVLLFEANAAMSFFPLTTDPQFAWAGGGSGAARPRRVRRVSIGQGPPRRAFAGSLHR